MISAIFPNEHFPPNARCVTSSDSFPAWIEPVTAMLCSHSRIQLFSANRIFVASGILFCSIHLLVFLLYLAKKMRRALLAACSWQSCRAHFRFFFVFWFCPKFWTRAPCPAAESAERRRAGLRWNGLSWFWSVYCTVFRAALVEFLRALGSQSGVSV